MSTINGNENNLEPPDSIIGMKILDRKKIFKTIEVPCIEVNSIDLEKILKIINKYLLKKHKLDPIQSNCGIANILINPKKFNELKNAIYFKELVYENKIRQIFSKKLDLTYENFNFIDLIRKILEKEKLFVSSFSIIGHIIHLNLKEELQPYKYIIGEILLDKNPNQNIVLNKLDKIDSIYRNFNFEILAKKNDTINTIVTSKESQIIFKFDFAEVYWNPRLSTEHQRILKIIPFYDIVFDVFAGVGPFAIPLAKKKKCKVFANDLNPISYKYLKENVFLNKVENIECFNLDGRQFIKEVIKPNLEKEWISRYNKFELSGVNFHVIMNLPMYAIDFLDEFSNLFIDCENEIIKKMYSEDKLILPIINCYTFTKHLEYQNFNTLIEEKLNFKIDNLDIFYVRNVAPLKYMFRLRFTMPKEVLFGKQTNKD